MANAAVQFDQYKKEKVLFWGIWSLDCNLFPHIFLLAFYDYLVGKFYSEKSYTFYARPDVCLWLLAALAGLSAAGVRRKVFLGILLPFGLYFIGILLGPVALMRYLYPLMLSTPMLFGALFRPDRQE